MDESLKAHPTRRKKTEKKLQPKLVPETGIEQERREKIEKIKQALANGTYQIPNEDVARKLIDHMRAAGDATQTEPKR